jgi:hypothetical protein
MTSHRFLALAAAALVIPVRPSLKPFTWERVAERYGWTTEPVYVLNAAAWQERLWAFEARAVYSSADGVRWDTATVTPPWRGTVPFGAVAVLGRRVWALGTFNDAARRSDVWVSSDGRSWARVVEHAPWSAAPGYAVLAHAGRLWVLDAMRAIWSSTDGRRWTQVCACGPWSADADFGAASYRGRIWVVGDDARVWSSADGARWLPVTPRAAWGARFRPAVVVYEDRLWVLGGVGKNDAWWSDDGARWTRQTADARWFPRGGLSAAVVGGALYVMGGKSGVSANSNPQDVWRLRRAPARSPGDQSAEAPGSL